MEQGAVVPFSLEQMDRQYRAGGVTVALGLPSIAYTEGRCAGGGTEINSGLYFRPPDDVIERWRPTSSIQDLDPDEIDAIADEVEEALSVTTVPGRPTPRRATCCARRRGARLAAQRDPAVDDLPAGGDAVTGTAAEHDPHVPAACVRRRRADGGRLPRRSLLQVTAGNAREATTTLTDGTRGTIRCRHVFVCGGAIQTPALLQRSRHRGRIGTSLAVHPTVKLAARFADEVNVPDDVPVHQVKEFAPDLSFGGSASQPGLVALALSDSGAHSPRRSPSGGGSACTTRRSPARVEAGCVRVPRPARSARHLSADPSRSRTAAQRSGPAGVADARGRRATRCTRRSAVLPSSASRADLATMQPRSQPSRASVMTVHLCSTVPMGEDSEQVRCRLVRAGAWHEQRLGQRCLVAAHRARVSIRRRR